MAASFELGEHNVDAVSEICRRLDGLPLAIELAATRLQSMSVSEIAARLERRLQFLHSNRRVHEMLGVHAEPNELASAWDQARTVGQYSSALRKAAGK